MGSRILIARVALRLWLAYLGVLVVLLLVLDAIAYAYAARVSHDILEPLLFLPEGRAVYAGGLRRVALWLLAADVPLLVAAGAVSYVFALISVRPLVAAREREARFAAEAAHELRTPLARIAALAQSGRDADAPAALASIERLAHEASQTVGDLLSLVREEKVPSQLAEPVDAGALVRSVAAALPRDGVAVDVDAAGDCWIVGDERRLRRLIENLAENALRHARTVVHLQVTPDGDRVALAVEDDGAGVPEEVRGRVFERFVRGPGDEGGTGLGLAICRTIARAHGGDVALEGPSRFVARLPRLDVKEL